MAGPLPLEGVKVADFTWAIAGPVTTKYLAIYGAQVVKIESHSRVDTTRIGPPFMGKPGRNSSGMFANYNPSKLSISLNLKVPEAQEVARRLVRWADVAVENFSAGQMAEWGLDYESLRKVNPRLIMLSSSQQGQDGPHASQPGLGGMLQALVGINHMTGWPDRDPRSPEIPMPDLIAPWFNISAIVGALELRDRTGEGQYLDVSQLETVLQLTAPSLVEYFANGQEGGRRGNVSLEAAPHNAYRCKGDDRWCVISVTTEEEWKAFKHVLGNPPWSAERRFSTLLDRLHNLEELDRLVTAWTHGQSPEEVMRRMQEAGVPAGLVADARDLTEDPQLDYRKHFQRVDYPGRGEALVDRPAFHILEAEPDIRRAPELGEHSETVCRDILCMPSGEYDALVKKGVFG